MKYIPENPCARGHMTERYAKSGQCVECINLTANEYRAANKDRLSAARKQNELNTIEKVRSRNKLYKINNKGKVNALKAKRKALKLQRTPRWSDLETIDQIYIKCAEISKTTGIMHHVDPILPLQAELVSGLHVPNNLQIITASENCSKRNSFEIT